MSTFLSGLARSKLHLAVGSGAKDNCSLHRWVLLKNSITQSQPSSPATKEPSYLDADLTYVYRNSSQDEDVEEECDIEDEDAFVFPNPDALLDAVSSSAENDSEAQWLDSLLETLTDDMGDDTHSHDDGYYSPSLSPISSSEDLVHASNFYRSEPITVPYPIPYPPLFHPPLILPQDLQYRLDHVDESRSLPYYDADELDDLSVPEAIDDTSDDESDTVTTPYSQSTASFAVDPASIPLPPDGLGVQPHVYNDTDDSYLYHPPFAGDRREYRSAVYQEC